MRTPSVLLNRNKRSLENIWNAKKSDCKKNKLSNNNWKKTDDNLPKPSSLNCSWLTICLKRLKNFVKPCHTLVNTRSKQRHRECLIELLKWMDFFSRWVSLNTVDYNNVAGSFNTAVIPELTDAFQTWQATPVRSSGDVNVGTRQVPIPSIGIASVPTNLGPTSTPASVDAVNQLPFFQPPPVNTTSKTVSSMTVPMVNPQNLDYVAASTIVCHSCYD